MARPLDALVPYAEQSDYTRAAYFIFDRVTVTMGGQPLLSFVGTVASNFPSGPSLTWLADAAHAATGLAGPFGLHSARRV